jgi:antitoxin ParD1/3/4
MKIKKERKGTKSDAMPTRNVNLTKELDGFIAYQVKSGRYENASEVVRDGLRILERAERQRLAVIRAAIEQVKARVTADGVQK